MAIQKKPIKLYLNWMHSSAHSSEVNEYNDIKSTCLRDKVALCVVRASKLSSKWKVATAPENYKEFPPCVLLAQGGNRFLNLIMYSFVNDHSDEYRQGRRLKFFRAIHKAIRILVWSQIDFLRGKIRIRYFRHAFVHNIAVNLLLFIL